MHQSPRLHEVRKLQKLVRVPVSGRRSRGNAAGIRRQTLNLGDIVLTPLVGLRQQPRAFLFRRQWPGQALRPKPARTLRAP